MMHPALTRLGFTAFNAGGGNMIAARNNADGTHFCITNGDLWHPGDAAGVWEVGLYAGRAGDVTFSEMEEPDPIAWATFQVDEDGNATGLCESEPNDAVKALLADLAKRGGLDFANA